MWQRLWARLFGERGIRAESPASDEGDETTTTAVDPLDGELDLHTFNPRDSADLVREYVLACHQKGVLALRIVHGKGKGVQRRSVHAVLADMPDVVLRYRLAEPERGGWGATLVDLRPR
jgi:DNA-nicking Smr family endonuclease